MQETKISECNPHDDIGNEVSDYDEASNQDIFMKNELSTAPDEIRYFKCLKHYGE